MKRILGPLCAVMMISCMALAQSLNLGGVSAFSTNGPAENPIAPTGAPAVVLPDPMSGIVPASAISGTSSDDISDLLRGGDTLIIRLTGVPTADQGIFEVKIDEAGKISMPHIGSLAAANNTTLTLTDRKSSQKPTAS
ncbi:MAG: hypothetical protein EBY81_02345 [Verrucomicrobia bacterium]|nr:hypothetical protein [Verrucomicrobiota bacterium]